MTTNKSKIVSKTLNLQHLSHSRYDPTELFRLKAGKLQFKENYAHGNPYYRLLRSEVEVFAKELLGDKGVEEQEIKHQLKSITREINSLKRKLSSLEKQKFKLLENI